MTPSQNVFIFLWNELKAKFMNIVIYDKDGRRINEVYGELGR